MVKIDIDMPASCADCPIRDNDRCPLVAGVPAWQAEIAACTDRRSEHCPLKGEEKNTKIPEYPCIACCSPSERAACCGCPKEREWKEKYGKC